MWKYFDIKKIISIGNFGQHSSSPSSSSSSSSSSSYVGVTTHYEF
jgi:hypothetical protein